MGKNGCVKCGHTEAKTKEIATTGTERGCLDT